MIFFGGNNYNMILIFEKKGKRTDLICMASKM